MTATIANHGPDDEGTWIGGPAALGHHRLAIIDIQGGRKPSVNAARIFPKSAEVKFPSFAAQTVAEGCPFFGGRPRGRDGGFNVGGVMEAFDRKCSGMSSACWRSR